MERLIELPEHGHPVLLTLGHVVQILLHLRGEFKVHDFREALGEQVGHGATEFGGRQPALLPLHVFALDQGGNGGSVGAGPADAFLFHLPDESGFREAWRRLGEMLVGFQFVIEQTIAGRQLGQGVLLAIAGIVPALPVNGAEAGKFENRSGGAETEHAVRGGDALGVDCHCGRFQQGVGHLAGHHPLPNEGVKAQLIPIQVGCHGLRGTPN